MLLPSAGEQVGDVEFVPRTDGGATAHDTAQTDTVMDVLSLSILAIRKACHVNRSQISRSQPVESGFDLGAPI